MSLKIGSLFSGYKGLDLAVESVLDAETAWFVEYDKAPSKILAHHWPDVPNYGDITTVDWSAVEPVDILTGGSPCQDLSHAGKRQGMTEGTRSNLWVAMREAIAQLRPSLVVWENVRGAYSAEASSELEHCTGCMGADRLGSGPVLRALGRVLGDLSDLGYDARWHGLRAADVGAPHGRFRVFVAAYPRGLRRGAWWPAVTGEAPRGWASADVAGRDLLPTPRATRGGSNTETVGLLPTPSVADGMGGHLTRSGSRSNELLLPGVAKAIEAQRLLPTPMSGDAKNARNSTATRHKIPPTGIHAGDTLCDITHADRWGEYADAIARWESLTRPAPAPTQPSKKGTPQLSPAFSEWLMGLPAGHVTDVPGLSRNDQLKALGNGVVPQQAAAALRHLLSYQEAS